LTYFQLVLYSRHYIDVAYSVILHHSLPVTETSKALQVIVVRPPRGFVPGLFLFEGGGVSSTRSHHHRQAIQHGAQRTAHRTHTAQQHTRHTAPWEIGASTTAETTVDVTAAGTTADPLEMTVDVTTADLLVTTADPRETTDVTTATGMNVTGRKTDATTGVVVAGVSSQIRGTLPPLCRYKYRGSMFRCLRE